MTDLKVWESIFSPSDGGGHAESKKKKKRSRISLSGHVHGGAMEGGATWTPLARRQRRHLELTARLLRIAQRLHVAEAEDHGDGTATEESLELMEGGPRRGCGARGSSGGRSTSCIGRWRM